MDKLRYNIENHWDYLTIWIKAPFNIEANRWFNLKVFKHNIKDKSLDDKNLFDF